MPEDAPEGRAARFLRDEGHGPAQGLEESGSGNLGTDGRNCLGDAVRGGRVGAAPDLMAVDRDDDIEARGLAVQGLEDSRAAAVHLPGGPAEFGERAQEGIRAGIAGGTAGEREVQGLVGRHQAGLGIGGADTPEADGVRTRADSGEAAAEIADLGGREDDLHGAMTPFP